MLVRRIGVDGNFKGFYRRSHFYSSLTPGCDHIRVKFDRRRQRCKVYKLYGGFEAWVKRVHPEWWEENKFETDN